MNTEALGETKETRKLVFHRVAENLYRLEMSGGYYALVKRGGKQFRRSLKTKDRKLAERRLAEFQAQVGNLTISKDARLSFDDLAKRWIETTRHTLKASSVIRREKCVKGIATFFRGMAIRNVQPQHCERWVKERGTDLAPQSFAHELNTMRAIFDYAVRLGLMLSNPAKDIKRKRIIQAKITIPTREQFKNLVDTIRLSDGREDSQKKAKAGADLVELLAYSGCRVSEATAIRWRDVDFEKIALTVTGGATGTKNHEFRVIPMTSALRSHLLGIKADGKPKDEDLVSSIASAKKCLETACRKLKYPKFSHHDFRHFYATTCIEAGVDIPTVSRWLGHKDGGALAMRVYGHLRQEHSALMIQRVIF
jgi:integrase